MQDFDWLSDLSPLYAVQEAWENGSYHEDSLFHLVYEPNAPFAISCGAGLLAEHLRRFRFSQPIIQALGQVTGPDGRPAFSESVLNYLQRLRLRVGVDAPPEGMLILPGEPLLIARGPYAQILLMESAFRWLIWRSTQWATRVAVQRWELRNWKGEDTPVAPQTGFSPDGWKIRAEYIGGAFADDILDTIRTPSRLPSEHEGLVCVWRESTGDLSRHIPVSQIRRLYKSSHAVGDIWLTDAQEKEASVSKNSVRMIDANSKRVRTLKFTRFQQLYQPVLHRGKPVIAAGQRLGYLRQRMLKQLDAFHTANLSAYPHGWYV